MEHDAMAQLAQTNPIATHLIVGGGAAGCVLANRLSADPDNRVILLEAGPDTLPEATPADILATYPGRAMANMDYFWPKLQARRGEGEYIPEAGRVPAFFHQARVAFRASAEILMHSAVAQITGNPFPSKFTERVAKISVPNASNRILTSMASMLLDSGVTIRTFLMDHFVNESPELASLMADDQAMTDYVCSAVVSLWHPSCTCRMGAADDPGAVVDEWGRVHGVENLVVCDASIMPNVPTTNTNIPTLMVAERIADHILSLQPGASHSRTIEAMG
jgi:choline dehydrogenase-like flavoprotein